MTPLSTYVVVLEYRYVSYLNDLLNLLIEVTEIERDYVITWLRHTRCQIVDFYFKPKLFFFFYVFSYSE